MTIKHLFPPAWPSLNLDFANSKSLDPRITFTRSSSGTYIDADGIVQTAIDDEPRFDHDPETGECLGLLIEESRTNYIENSTDFNAGDWTFATNGTSPGIPVCTPNSGTAPDGSNTATRLEASTGGGTSSSDVSLIKSNRDTTSRAQVSVWMKSNTGADQTVYAAGLGSPVVTTEWKRFTAGSNDWRIGARGEKSQENVDILIWGAQVEDGDKDTGFCTSYIPTAGATATRAVDIANIAGTNFSSWYNQNEGTIFAEFAGQTHTAGTLTKILSFADDDSTSMAAGNGILFGSHTGGPDEQRWLVRASSITYLSLATETVGSTALAYATSDLAMVFDGGTVESSTNSPPTSLDRLNMFPANVPISRIAYYPTRLPDEQLQTLTS